MPMQLPERYQSIENGFYETSKQLFTRKTGREYLNSREKRILDICCSRAFKPIITPALAAARLLVWAEDGSPTIISVPRVGKDGVLFYMPKIRSMEIGSEKMPQPLGPKDPADPRITNAGRFLRRLSLDELPQTACVGSYMSWVGNRPKPPGEFRALCRRDDEFGPSYTGSLPGITGLEQLNGRADLGPKSRIDLTKQYDQEAHLLGDTGDIEGDVEMIISTFRALRSHNGAY